MLFVDREGRTAEGWYRLHLARGAEWVATAAREFADFTGGLPALCQADERCGS